MRTFFDRWYPRLVCFLYARLGDQDLAEDLAQESFLRLLKNRPRRAESWLFTVAANLARDEVRLARRRSVRLALVRGDAEGREPGPEPDLLRREQAERVRRALHRLSERDETLLLLHHGGFRYREIAEQLGLSPGSIGPLLTRAERRFVESYTSEGRDEQRASA